MRGLRWNELESNDVVAGLDASHALADRFNDTSTLMTQDRGELTLWVLAGQCVGI